jgi:NTP pyrophosphatase (non-canonical NTP hydrolase)
MQTDHSYDLNEHNTLREANVNRQAEWDPSDAISHSYRGNELAGELGEALEKALALIELSAAVGRLSNMIKKVEREQLGLRGSRVSLADVAEELGDTQICLDLVAMKLNIDLDQAAKEKFNATSIKYGLKTRYV